MLSKLRKMKAIHNASGEVTFRQSGVVMLSKLRKMKAIHNFHGQFKRLHPVL